jgi:hypothetical protein
MNEPTLEIVVQRLTRLERENRWWRRATGAMLVGIAALSFMGQGSAKRLTLEVEKIVFKDTSGKTRAELGVMSNGSTVLNLYDATERRRISLGAMVDGTPELLLFDSESQPRIWLTLDRPDDPIVTRRDGKTIKERQMGRDLMNTVGERKDAPRLSFYDRDGTPSFDLSGTETPPSDLPPLSTVPTLALYDNKGKAKVVLKAFHPIELYPFKSPGGGRLELSGSPSIYMLDASDQTRAGLKLGFGGEPSMTFYDKKTPKPDAKEAGQPPKDWKQISEEIDKASARATRAMFGVSADGEPYLILADEEGNHRAVLGLTLLEGQRTGEVTKRPTFLLGTF